MPLSCRGAGARSRLSATDARFGSMSVVRTIYAHARMIANTSLVFGYLGLPFSRQIAQVAADRAILKTLERHVLAVSCLCCRRPDFGKLADETEIRAKGGDVSRR